MGRRQQNTGFGPFGQLTLDYDFTSKLNLNGSFRVNDFAWMVPSGARTIIFLNGNQRTEKYLLRIRYKKQDGLNYDASLDLKRTFKKTDQELVLSTQLTNSNQEYRLRCPQDCWIVCPNFPQKKQWTKAANCELTVQLDYTHPFSKNCFKGM